eukprot:361556-Chlamydomonas_euryale.AAC.1
MSGSGMSGSGMGGSGMGGSGMGGAGAAGPAGWLPWGCALVWAHLLCRGAAARPQEQVNTGFVVLL